MRSAFFCCANEDDPRDRLERLAYAHAFCLLRPRRERPRSGRTAEKRDELTSPHGHPSSGLGPHITRRCGRTPLCIKVTVYSINSSARPMRGSGTVRPSFFAVLRLIISSTTV